MTGHHNRHGGTTAWAADADDMTPPIAVTFCLDDVVRQYESCLLRYVTQAIGKQHDEAQDIVQEAFLRLHRQVEKAGAGSITNLRCWLYRVAYNLAMDAGRQRGRRKKLQEQVMSDPVINPEARPIEHDGASGKLERQEACNLAMGELQHLPYEQKNVLLLKIIQGMTLQEISTVTGLKIGTVNYRLTQGLRTLADRLRTVGAL